MTKLIKALFSGTYKWMIEYVKTLIGAALLVAFATVFVWVGGLFTLFPVIPISALGIFILWICWNCRSEGNGNHRDHDITEPFVSITDLDGFWDKTGGDDMKREGWIGNIEK